MNFYIENTKCAKPFIKIVLIACTMISILSIIGCCLFQTTSMEDAKFMFADSEFNGNYEELSSVYVKIVYHTVVGIDMIEFDNVLSEEIMPAESYNKDGKLYDALNDKYVVTQDELITCMETAIAQSEFTSGISERFFVNFCYTTFIAIIPIAFLIYAQVLKSEYKRVCATVEPTWCNIEAVKTKALKNYTYVEMTVTPSGQSKSRQLKFLVTDKADGLEKGSRVLCKLASKLTTYADIDSLDTADMYPAKS